MGDKTLSSNDLKSSGLSQRSASSFAVSSDGSPRRTDDDGDTLPAGEAAVVRSDSGKGSLRTTSEKEAAEDSDSPSLRRVPTDTSGIVSHLRKASNSSSTTSASHDQRMTLGSSMDPVTSAFFANQVIMSQLAMNNSGYSPLFNNSSNSILSQLMAARSSTFFPSSFVPPHQFAGGGGGPGLSFSIGSNQQQKAIPFGGSQDYLSRIQASPNLGNPGGGVSSARRGGPIVLFMACDEDSLSEYQCLIRKQVELFEADKEEAASSVQGRNKQVVEGQIGIRCRHCTGVPARKRQKGAMYFPTRLDRIYQAAQNLSAFHLCENCKHVPPDVRRKLLQLRERKSPAGGGKLYWAEGARCQGVYEAPDGLRLHQKR